THAHADHLTAADFIKQKIGGKTVIGAGITKVQQHFAPIFNMGIVTDGSQFDRLVSEGDSLDFAGMSIEIFETPGHTSDSIIYKIDDNIFLGDTFFHPNSGTARCDFPGGDAKQLFDSLSKILSFADTTKLWLCHDYPGSEREAQACFSVEQMKNNVHMANQRSKADYVELRKKRDAQLAVPKLLYPALQVNICAGKLPKAEENGANYLKIPLHIKK
ncbi:MAG: MBL fold metallo-hydrolase, partial [Gammaproteobacteria bacterium]|nr:MBL fold metallo-hydrolase [Gammaproteobacteria bacterium]